MTRFGRPRGAAPVGRYGEPWWKKFRVSTVDAGTGEVRFVGTDAIELVDDEAAAGEFSRGHAWRIARELRARGRPGVGIESVDTRGGGRSRCGT